MVKGVTKRKYSQEFKLSVIIYMRRYKLSHKAIMRKFFPYHKTDSASLIRSWERELSSKGVFQFLMKDKAFTNKVLNNLNTTDDNQIATDNVNESSVNNNCLNNSHNTEDFFSNTNIDLNKRAYNIKVPKSILKSKDPEIREFLNQFKDLQVESDIFKMVVQALEEENQFPFPNVKEVKKKEIVNTLKKDAKYTYEKSKFTIALSNGSYYYKYNTPVYAYEKYNDLVVSIFYENNYNSGINDIVLELKNVYNIKLNHKTVQTILHNNGLRGTGQARRGSKYKDKKPQETHEIDETYKVKNIINRDFTSTRPYEKLYSDVTEFHIKTGQVLYVSMIKDGYGKNITSYSMSLRNNADLVVENLKNLKKVMKTDKKVILHTDQGGLYKSKKWINFINAVGITPSMSRKGNCYDNAPAESFFSSLKKGLKKETEYNSIKQLKKEIIAYIERYNLHQSWRMAEKVA